MALADVRCYNKLASEGTPTYSGCKSASQGRQVKGGLWVSHSACGAMGYYKSAPLKGANGLCLGEGGLEDEGVVVGGVVGGVEEGDHGFVGDELAQSFECGIGLEFPAVALLELGPLRRRVFVEPLAQLCGGSDFFVPEVVMESFVGESAGPEAVHIDSEAVGGRSRLVGAFGEDCSFHVSCFLLLFEQSKGCLCFRNKL